MAEEEQKRPALSAAEYRLIELIREVGYGQMLITIKESRPCRVEEIHKSIPLN